MTLTVETLAVGPLEANCYLLSSGADSPVVIVDPGAWPRVILDAVGDRAVSEIVITHRHFDHVGALAEVAEATGATVSASASEASAVVEPHGNLSNLMGEPTALPRPDRILEDGDVVNVGAVEMKVLLTPGHTDGGICLYGGGALISGDTIFAGSWGRTDLPSGSERQLHESFSRVLSTLDDETAIYPGHGPSSTIGREKRLNPLLRRASMLP